MGWIPTVRLFKEGRTIKVNADDTLRYCREGWSRENPGEQKGTKKEMTPDEKTAEAMIQEELLKAEPESKPEPKLESKPESKLKVLNIDDLQAE